MLPIPGNGKIFNISPMIARPMFFFFLDAVFPTFVLLVRETFFFLVFFFTISALFYSGEQISIYLSQDRYKYLVVSGFRRQNYLNGDLDVFL